jgi:hypothetical protein
MRKKKVPVKVVKAVDVIAEYVRKEGLKHVIVGASGNPAFVKWNNADVARREVREFRVYGPTEGL